MSDRSLPTPEPARPSPPKRLTGGIAIPTVLTAPISSSTLSVLEKTPPTAVASTAPVDLLRKPLRALWDHRQETMPLPGQIHITVPLEGGPPRAEAAARVTRYLEQMWVSNPVATSIEVTSVATTIVADPTPDAVAPFRLSLMLTFRDSGATPADLDLETSHMARHLETAISQLA